MSLNDDTIPQKPSENDVRRELIATCLQLDGARLNAGRSGNLSARWHRGHDDGMLITPSAMRYADMQPDHIVWMPFGQDNANDGDIRYDGMYKPSSEWRMHMCLYGQNDVAAVLHVHSSFATSLACLPRVQTGGIPAFHYMIAVAGGNSLRCADYHLFGSRALSDAMAQAMQDRRACLLANHGQIATGNSIGGAFELAQEVETLSKMYWQALQIDEPAILSDEQMTQVHEAFAQYRYRG
jgi:L-fuculose-phosphate aldolase